MLSSLLITRLRSSEMKANLKLKGIGVSFVDSEPKEVLYISIYKIHIEFIQTTEVTENEENDQFGT